VQLLDEYDPHQFMEIAISILLGDHDWDKSDLMEWIVDHQWSFFAQFLATHG